MATAPRAAEPLSVAVACSGGRDSTALLHSTWRWASEHGAHIVALHVHHGLNPQADAWRQHVQRQCRTWSRRWPLVFSWCRLDGSPAAGESIEAWARAGRYRALRTMALEAGCRTVLLAHHRRDQAETFLLQALRGAGAAGLASMPKTIERDGICWLRPWLDMPSSAIAHYIARWHLRHIEDGSNQDTRFARNRLRHDIWPTLLQAFPQAETALCHSARQAQHQLALLADVVPPALVACTHQGRLQLPAWRLLGTGLRWFVLKAWLEHALAQAPPEHLVSDIVADLEVEGVRSWTGPGDCRIRRYRDELWLPQPRKLATTANWPPQSALPVAPQSGTQESAPRCATQVAAPLPSNSRRKATDTAKAPTLATNFLTGPGTWHLPEWGGTLTAQRTESAGLPWHLLAQAHLGPRQAGDRLALFPHSRPRSLKKQYQALGIPSWLRDGPCLRRSHTPESPTLLWVAGLGANAAIARCAGAKLQWEPDAPEPEAVDHAEKRKSVD